MNINFSYIHKERPENIDTNIRDFLFVQYFTITIIKYFAT